ncbi:MAG: S1 RNA-binding domain-containing protein [Acidobacteriota bacterium]
MTETPVVEPPAESVAPSTDPVDTATPAAVGDGVAGEEPAAATEPSGAPPAADSAGKRPPRVKVPPDSRKVAEVRSALQKAFKQRTAVEGKVIAIVRGGYEVDLGGVTGFCPFNQIDIRRNDDQLSFALQTLSFVVTAFRRGGRGVTLSRRRILEREASKAERQARRSVKAGSTLDGKVTSLTDFGAFVDLGGAQGMIHVSEISHQRVSRPADRLKVGETVRVRVLRSDPRKGRIALSLKALEPDPWKVVATRLRAHDVTAGRLVRVTDFGVFVEVEPGVDGLIHMSELPAGGLEAMKERLTSSPEMNVMILRVEAGKKRVSLAPAPEGTQPGDTVKVVSTRPGTIVTGSVESTGAEGVTVRLGPGTVGLIPASETGAPRGADLRKLFAAGSEVKALVMRSERDDRRPRLSIRRAARQEEKRQLQDYRKSASSGAGSFATLGDLFPKRD